MKIAIDLNDVIRDFSQNFLKYYLQGYNHEFKLDDFEFWSNDMRHVFNFTSDASYYDFVYNDYAFELFGKCGTCSRNTTTELNYWLEKTIEEIDCDEPIEVMFVSPMEYGLSIGNTCYFISKLGSKVREIYLPIESNDIWKRCDVLVTANPDLINNKPENKVVVKIETEYNQQSETQYSYPSFSSFINDVDLLEKLANNNGKEQ